MHIYIDCTLSGISGNMLLGALIDMKPELADTLTKAVKALELNGVSVEIKHITTKGISATFVDVIEDKPQPHRHYSDLVNLVTSKVDNPRICNVALNMLKILGEAEAAVHNIPLEKVHFHEVGAADTIVDIVGVATLLSELGVQSISCSAVPICSGTIQCQHGLIPNPAPATVNILGSVTAQTEPKDCNRELVTPTGAAMVAALTDIWGPPPAGNLMAQGFGAGSMELPWANVLRVILMKIELHCPGFEQDQVTEIVTNIDDATGEQIGTAIDAMLAVGALDAWAIPATMKKGRVGHELHIIGHHENAARYIALLCELTGTFGVRMNTTLRAKLLRYTTIINVLEQKILVHFGVYGRRIVSAKPEWSDCLKASDHTGLPPHRIARMALELAPQPGDNVPNCSSEG